MHWLLQVWFETKNIIGVVFWVQLEKKLDEVEQFYKSSDVQLQANDSKNKSREKPPFSTNKKPPLYRASSRELTASEEMQEVRRHFSKIFHEASESIIIISYVYIYVSSSSYLNFIFTEFLNWTWTNNQWSAMMHRYDTSIWYNTNPIQQYKLHWKT